MNRLRWIFEIVDRMSGPAKAAAKAINAVDRALAATKRTAATAAGSFRGFANSLVSPKTRAAALKVGLDALKGAAGAAGSALRTAFMGALAGGALAAVVAGVATLKGAIDAVVARDRQLRGLTILSGGNRQVALRQRARFLDLADFLGLSPGEVADQMTELMSKGFSEVESVRLFQALSDVSSFAPSADNSRIITAISQIRQAGVLQGDELNQLAESGLPLQHVYERIAQAMGHTGPDSAKFVRGLRGTIPAAVAIQGILDGIRDTTGQELGAVARESSMSLGGLLERISTAPERFFASLADGSDAMSGRFRAMLERLNQLLDPNSATAQSMMTAIMDIIDGIINGLNSAIPKIAEFMRWVQTPDGAKTMTDLWNGTKLIATALFDVARAIAYVVVGFGAIGYYFGAGVAAIIDYGGRAVAYVQGIPARLRGAFGTAEEWKQIGRSIMEGLALGIQELAMLPVTAITTVGTNLATAAREALDIHSPSRVFEEIGAMTAAGFAVGIEGGPPPELGMPEVGAAAGGFGNTATLNLTINVNGGDESIGEQVRDALLPELARFFDDFAIEQGA